MKKYMNSKWIVIVSLTLALISMAGASFVQTSGGKTTVKDMTWETPSGKELSALLFVPEGVDADNPAPTIITSHGWYNTREMQDLNYVEYSRRGYVVLAIDMYGHGDSETVAPDEWSINGTGMYDAVELASTLPYVDNTKIGITGHSNGGRAANWSIDVDNLKENPLVSSVLLVANDANYKNPETEEYYNKYGSRDVGIVAAQYDEFFFRTMAEDGSITAPRDYIDTSNAQSFLNFGQDPTDLAERSSYEFYTETIDGKETNRVIFNPAQTHPWNHFSKSVVSSSLDFFDSSLGAPKDIDSSSQIWQFKAAFNGLGLIAFAMFIVGFTKLMLNTTIFRDLKAKDDVLALPAPQGKQKAWYWIPLAIMAVFSGLSAIYIFPVAMMLLPILEPLKLFNQQPTFYVGLWSLISGLVALLIIWFVNKFNTGNKNIDYKKRGLTLTKNKLLKTILLALLVTAASFSLVFIADYFFTADFRLWIVAIRAFGPDKLGIALRYAPFFLIFYMINSVSLNVFNYLEISKKEWVNTLLAALSNAIGVIVIIIIQYATFFKTGHVFFGSFSGILGIWLIPIAVYLMVAAVISRKIYKATNNPYLGGMIVGLVITIISVTNTLTQLL